jgi:outer membrane receptor for ferrienterochelin and colicin
MRCRIAGVLVVVFAFTLALRGASFGNVRGNVLDPSDRPIPGAIVTIHSRTSDWSQTAQSAADGTFQFAAVPVGDYVVSVAVPGFSTAEHQVEVTSGSARILSFDMAIAGVRNEVAVTAAPETIASDSPTPETVVGREEIAQTPGADRTNSLSIITDFVPGTYMTHDQLHIRGGHQVSWAVDGVPVPNTNIASNVGPQFDPKDVDYLEVLRGSYSSEYGDRTYGVFNIAPRTGFERHNEGELVTSFGNFYQTNDHLSFGSHTDRFAYFASVNGNRSNLGLETPSPEIIHDRQNGAGGFGSLIFSTAGGDQLRVVASLRRDFYQIPNDADAQAGGIRDAERENDAFVNFSWVHTIGTGTLLTVSPFYHYNRANFLGGPQDPELQIQQDRSSKYAGAQVTLGAVTARHNAKVGFYGFGQSDSTLFGVRSTDDAGVEIRQTEAPSGHLLSGFVQDEYRPTSWLHLNGGLRLTRFSGDLMESAVSPRIGAAIEIPRVRWVVRGFYGRFYQAPPLSTVSGPLLSFVLDQGFGVIPLRGERDEERQFGVSIPIREWTVDADNFRTRTSNFFDHNAVGNSNIFFPLTIDTARIRGTEFTLRSPRLEGRAQFHAAYSHQYAEGFGGISGGLTEFEPPEEGFFLDHDQRDTFSAGIHATLAGNVWTDCNVAYGSGFVDEEGPEHLPGHTTLDVSLGRNFGENLSVSVTALNIANRHFLLDNSLTFGGTHYFNPREIFVQARYRFHY